MCNTSHDPNKGKEKENEESVTKQNNETKRKVIVLEEKPDAESKSLKCLKNGNVCGYQYYEFDVMNQHVDGSSSFDAWDLHHFQHIDQNSINQQVTIDFGLVSVGDANSNVDHEHTEYQEEEEAPKNIDLNLKL
ncbi:unnamed protein product [Lathyrus oleraceus]